MKDKDIEQLRLPGKQVILAPDKYKAALVKHSFEKARKQALRPAALPPVQRRARSPLNARAVPRARAPR